MVFYSKVPGIKNIQASFSLVLSPKMNSKRHACMFKSSGAATFLRAELIC